MAATDWAAVSQGVRMLWRRPYSVWLAAESAEGIAMISGGRGASPENRFKVTEMLASDDEGTRICYYTTQRRWRVCPAPGTLNRRSGGTRNSPWEID